MTRPCDEIEPRIDALLDGELDAAERAEVEAHLAGCERCRRARDEVVEVKGLVATVPAEAPAAGDVERLVAAIRGAPVVVRMHAPRASGWRDRVRIAAVALVIVVAGVIATVLGPAGRSLAYAPGIWVHFEEGPAPAPRSEALREPLPADLAGIRGADAVTLTAAERLVLSQGRTIWRPAPERTFAEFYEHGERIGAAPLFTADLAFAALSRTLAAAERRIEEEVVLPEARALASALHAALERDLAGGPPGAVREALTTARDYVAVGLAIANAKIALSPRAAVEIDLVRRAEGIDRSPVTGALVDYAALGPPPLGPDRMIAWFARSGLPLDDPAGAAAALALAHALASPDAGPGGLRPLARYERARERLAFFRGAPDDWAPERLLPELRSVWGPRLRLEDLPAAAGKVVAARLAPPEIPGPNGARPLFSLLGTRYDAEARAIAEATRREGRLLGTGLDLLSLEAAAPRGAARRPRHEDDLFALVAHARAGLDLGEPGRTTNTALLTIEPLAFGEDAGAWAPARPAAPAAPPVRGSIDPAPAFFARLGALAAAVADALVEGDPFPSRDALVSELGALAKALSGERGEAALLASLAPRPRAALVVNVVVRPGTAELVQTRVIRGPIEVLRVVPTPAGPTLVRGAGLAVHEIPLERRLRAAEVDKLPELPAEPWLKSWRAPK